MSRVSKSSPAPFPFSSTPFLTLESFRTDVKLIERESFGNGTVADTVRFDADVRTRHSS